jgi:cytochrome c556
MPGIHRPIALAAAITIIVAAGAAFALSGAEVVQMRRAAFDEMAQVLQFAARNWREPSAYPDIARAARIIERDARSLGNLFPAGTGPSDGYRTAALDAVWSDRQGFDQLVSRLTEQAAGMTSVTTATAQDQVKEGLTGIIGTCRACHRDYRAN